MTQPITNTVPHAVKPLSLGKWRFSGLLGQRVDAMSQARLNTPEAWNTIYPETEEAFRLREDDTSHPGRGVWRGEFWGKYVLSAIASCRYYGDEQLKARIAQAVQGLLSTQEDNGYIGTYRDSSYAAANTWNVWGRKYTLWALLEAWELLGDPAILEAASRMADHLIGEFGPGAQDIISTGQFCGLPSTSILKPIVMLYRATGKQDYLKFAEYIVDQWRRHPQGIPDIVSKGLSGDPIHTWFDNPEKWAKSYEFVSCVEGLLDLYGVSGKAEYMTAGRNIYDAIVEWERSPVGSISFNDKFIGSRFLINTVSEICDAVYWNRLAVQLFLLTKDIRYIDEIELTLYNTLLCGLKPDGSWALRRLRLTHEHIPAHNHFLKHHQCCVDNVPRGMFQAAETVAFTDGQGVYLALYNSGSGSVELPSGRRASLTMQGDFLDDGKVRIELSPEAPEPFTLRLRMPVWSKATAVAVNGSPVPAGHPGSWLSLDREWSPGDTITLQFDVELRAEFFDPSKFAPDDQVVAWHEQIWASMGVISEDNLKIKQLQHTPLSVEDAQPHAEAVMLFRGPLALARDIRLGDERIFSPLPAAEGVAQLGRLVRGEDVEGIWKTFDLVTPSGETVRFCDFASSGNTWDERSLFAAWQKLDRGGAAGE